MVSHSCKKLLPVGEYNFLINSHKMGRYYPEHFLFEKSETVKYVEVKFNREKVDSKKYNMEEFFKLVEEKINIDKYHISLPKPPIPQILKIGIIKHLSRISKRSFILHGAAILNSKGKADIFVAKSGGGKSTLCKFFPGRVLNDDILIITKGKRDFFVQPTPFGICEKIECRKAGNIFYLKKDIRNMVKSINLKEGLKLFLENTPPFSNYNLILDFFKDRNNYLLHFNLNLNEREIFERV